jgi:hypothetical protein
MKTYTKTSLLSMVAARNHLDLEQFDASWSSIRKTLIADYGATNEFGTYKIPYVNLEKFISERFKPAPATNT